LSRYRLPCLAYGECFVPLPRPDLLSLVAQEKVGKEKGTLHGALRSFAAAGT